MRRAVWLALAGASLMGCFCAPLNLFGGGEAPPPPPPRERAISPRPPAALEAGLDFGTETLFQECSDPDGVSGGLFAGVAWRPRGRLGLGLRAGGSLAVLDDDEHATPIDARDQLWVGPQVHDTGAGGVQLSFTPFAAWSRYHTAAGATAAWGGGAAVDLFGGAGLTYHVGVRVYADRSGIFGGLALGVALLR